MKTLRILASILILSFLIQACSNDAAKTSEDADKEHTEHEESNVVSLSNEQAKAIGVQLGIIEQKQLTASLKVNGYLKVPNQNKASVASLYGGVVKTIAVQPGISVRKGQAIATLSNAQFIAMQEEYLSLEAKVKYAQLEFNRQKELSSNNAGALRTFQQSESELATLQTRKASLHKQLDLIGINATKLTNENIQSTVTITSPISGMVSRILVNIGSNVADNSPLAEIVDNSQLHLDLFVYERDLAKIRVGQTIHFTLTNNPGKEYDAHVFGIGSTFEDESKAVAVHALVQGDKTGLIEGMGITAIVSLENATVPSLPTDAIVSYQGTDFIFIETEPQHFERIPIRVGTTDVGYSEVTLLKEIPSESKIVVKGAFFLLAKMTNSGEHED